ncbi:protein of unknown function [Burkholderia multivorans]
MKPAGADSRDRAVRGTGRRPHINDCRPARRRGQLQRGRQAFGAETREEARLAHVLGKWRQRTRRT